MYDQNFKNQAVKECVNGQSMNATAKKYGVSITAVRDWVHQYKERMSNMKTGSTALVMPDNDKKTIKDTDGSGVKLKSINVNIHGNELTMSKEDVVKLMEIFYQFDK